MISFLRHVHLKLLAAPQQAFGANSLKTTKWVCVEIVINDMRKLKMSADFSQIHPMTFVGVQEYKVLLYIGGM